MERRRGRRRAWANSRRWTAELAHQALEAFEQSGLTLRDFAEREGVSAKRLERWHRRLLTEGQSAPAFVELTTQEWGAAEDDRGTVFEVVLGTGRLVRVPVDFNENALRRLVAVLEELPC